MLPLLPLLFLSRVNFPSRMAKLLGRMWDRAQGKLVVLRICDKVFEELADKNTKLLDVSSLHIATLMVYSVTSPRRPNGIPQEEFRKLIMEWVSKDLLLELADRAKAVVMIAPMLAVKTKNAVREVPRMRDALEKVPCTLLLFTVFSVGLILL